ncbi:DNA mismatch repair ATPase msh1 [Gamsiella multidivaricata]|nr:DNA mismatch repair ATPase msh1 [Gamsiella multidivaricata]
MSTRSCIRLRQVIAGPTQTPHPFPLRNPSLWSKVTHRPTTSVPDWNGARVATKSTTRYYHDTAIRPSPPWLKDAKHDASLQNASETSSQPTTTKNSVSKPIRSVLSFTDLISVNPNPTVLPADIPLPVEPTEEVDVKLKKKRKSKAKVDEKAADQEVITTIADSAGPKNRLTPLRKQILDLEAAYPDCVLLVRVGEFYELYDHNAVEYGPLLGLKMTSKTFSGQSIPFTGFPVRQLDRHLETLVSKHHLKVALCEQFLDDHEGGNRSFRRSVYRIITPGTLIDEQFLDQGENNWLLAVATDKTSRLLGLSWLDLSTGDFFTQETTYDSFPNDLARIRPREIIVNSNLKYGPEHAVLQTIQKLGPFVVSFEDMRYVNHTQMGRRPVVQQPIEWQDGSIVKIDRNTIEALELVRTLRDSSRMGSLLHHLDRTKTKAGSRLLADWLTSPLTSINKINRRLDMVEFLGKDTHLMYDIDSYLKECRDAQRAIQKLSLGQIDPYDLIAIRNTLEALQKIKKRMADKIMLVQGHARAAPDAIPALVKETVDSIHGLEQICNLIRNVVDESMEQRQEYGYINEGVNPALNGLHVKLRELKERRKALLDKWTSHLGGAKPFEIKSSFGYRHVVEMRSTITAERLRDMVNGQVVDVSHTDQRRSKVRFQIPVLSEIMESIERMEAQIVQEEKSILSATRLEILEESTAIIQNCRYLAQLDVLLSFAYMMLERHYTRPVLNQGGQSVIVSGRHPVVEIALYNEGRQFVENNCSVGQEELMWLITGPNMGGKSTFLRQNAILTIMAQMGCFVPATSAHLGIVDKVFSRLGASDNLANAQSTFMVEMTETASILQHATEKSLVIMDEVGRGTATLDGCAIAYATLHHLYHINKCRTLFATHYHELADMVGAINGSHGYSSALSSQDDATSEEGASSAVAARTPWRGQEPLDHGFVDSRMEYMSQS